VVVHILDVSAEVDWHLVDELFDEGLLGAQVEDSASELGFVEVNFVDGSGVRVYPLFKSWEQNVKLSELFNVTLVSDGDSLLADTADEVGLSEVGVNIFGVGSSREGGSEDRSHEKLSNILITLKIIYPTYVP
jgi:hypothetical protein